MYFDVYCDSGVKQKIRTSISHLFCEYFSIRRGFPMVSFVTEMIYLNANVNRLFVCKEIMVLARKNNLCFAMSPWQVQMSLPYALPHLLTWQSNYSLMRPSLDNILSIWYTCRFNVCKLLDIFEILLNWCWTLISKSIYENDLILCDFLFLFMINGCYMYVWGEPVLSGNRAFLF